MSRPVVAILVLACMVLVIVGLDLAFFRHQFWARLAVNAGVVLVFVGVYLRFGGRPWVPWR